MSPQKSKRNRRDITPAVAASAAAAAAAVNPTQNTPAAKPVVKSNVPTVPLPTTQSFTRDLSWIGLTTLIVVILMVVAYYVVPR
jgi:hypothetical protein